MAMVTCHVSIAYYFVVFMIFFFLSEFSDSSSAEVVGNVCQSAECIEIAERITKNMDTSILPCDDFYKFVCNKFHENKDKVPKPRTFPKTSSLARPSSLQQDSPLQKAYKIYTLCMAQNMTNQYEIEAIRQVIQKIGGWPLVEGGKWHEKELEEIVSSLSQSGYYSGIFFEHITGINGQKSVIHVLPIYNYAKIEDIDHVAAIAFRMGANSSNITEIRETIRDVSDHFGNFHPDNAVSLTELTIEDMMVRWPSIDWMTYFTSYFANSPNVTINTNTNVSLSTNHVNNVVDFIARTSKEQIMNYIISCIVMELRPYFPEFVMRSDVSVHVSTDPFSVYREKYCEAVNSHSTRGIKYRSLGAHYINNKIQDEFLNVSELMKNKMGELINQAHLDNQTLENHQETLSGMTIEIFGHNRRTVESFDRFNDLVLNEQDFGDTLWNVLKFHRNLQIERKKEIGLMWQLIQAGSKTFRNKRSLYADYSDGSNKITVHMDSDALLSYQVGFPKYFNYGIVGNTIGHEIGHGVSQDEMMLFAWNSPRLSQARRNDLSSKLDCFKRQYEAYIKELNMTIWKAHSVIEDVADHIGRKLAHLVYKDRLDTNGPEPQLPNLNYTSMQMFWITYAYDWCDNDPELEWVNRWDTRDHSPSRYRVNMPLSNNPAFSKAFKCEPGSRMNPVEKCSYW